MDYLYNSRAIATADYGTNETTGDTYSNGSEPSYTTDPPAAAAGGPHVTRYEYDAAGRQSKVTHPDSSVTRNEYDGLGRLILLTENAESANAAEIRRTAYFYECADAPAGSVCNSGRLLKMAAVISTALAMLGLHGGATLAAASTTPSARDVFLVGFLTTLFDSLNKYLLSVIASSTTGNALPPTTQPSG